MVERDRPRIGPCLLCGNRENRLPNLIEHIRTNHSDQTSELMAELMIRIDQMKTKIEGLSSRT
jgi:hypothetical protein